MMKHVRILRVIGPVLLVLLAAGCAHWLRAAPVVVRNTLVVDFMGATVVAEQGSQVRLGTHGIYLYSGAVFVKGDSGQHHQEAPQIQDGLHGRGPRGPSAAAEVEGSAPAFGHYKVKTKFVVVGDWGTEFLVGEYADSTVIAVLTGRVRADWGTPLAPRFVYLGPNDQAAFNDRGLIYRINPMTPATRTRTTLLLHVVPP